MGCGSQAPEVKADVSKETPAKQSQPVATPAVNSAPNKSQAKQSKQNDDDDDSLVKRPKPAALNLQVNLGAQQQLKLEEKVDVKRVQKRVTEHMMINELDLKMHGGSEMNFSSPEFISDAQFQIQAPTGVVIKITATGKGNVELVAVKMQDEFPLVKMADIITSSGVAINTATIEVPSPSMTGFIVLIASGGQTVDVHVDGQGKQILSLVHIDPLP